jgi:hypothetical protein
LFDPWYDDLDNIWENKTDWPANWRGQYYIEEWYKQQDIDNLRVYQWKTDIFGNQYALLKAGIADATIYEKKHKTSGSMWTRDNRNIILPAVSSLSNVFEYIPPAASGTDYITSVLDMDIWFDTLMIYTSTGLYFFHLNYDYEDGIISSTSDEINYIITQNSKFGGTWFHEEDKKVTICTLMSCNDQIRPVLRSLDLDTNKMSYLYNVSSTYTDMSTVSLTSYDYPLFTYDKNTRTYNVGYFGNSNTKDGVYFTTINLRDYGNYLDIISSKTITPNA